MAKFRAIFFDFGGCIDAPGIHSRTLFFDAFQRIGFELSRRAEFQEAYTMADRRMMASGEAKGMGLREFNRHNSDLIARELRFDVGLAEAAAEDVSAQMDGFIRASRLVLERLHPKIPLGIISNFTGNLQVILADYALKEIFETVTESFYVGASKPDGKIFLSALERQGVEAADSLYVGDNPSNDIAPAKALGFRTALIHSPGHKPDCGADFYIQSLAELEKII